MTIIIRATFIKVAKFAGENSKPQSFDTAFTSLLQGLEQLKRLKHMYMH
ncbi:MAG: hypothetical protein OSA86_12030 [Acidimicrobiales bacterium]|nr:hypothetical protein [Acidimicrobiales bacterium]